MVIFGNVSVSGPGTFESGSHNQFPHSLVKLVGSEGLLDLGDCINPLYGEVKLAGTH